jgi:hypothetical protein
MLMSPATVVSSLNDDTKFILWSVQGSEAWDLQCYLGNLLCWQVINCIKGMAGTMPGTLTHVPH